MEGIHVFSQTALGKESSEVPRIIEVKTPDFLPHPGPAANDILNEPIHSIAVTIGPPKKQIHCAECSLNRMQIGFANDEIANRPASLQTR